MSLGNLGSRLRCLVVWSAASAGTGLTVLVAHQPATSLARLAARGGMARTPLDVVLTDLAATVLVCCAAWLWLVTTAVVLEAACGVRPGARPPRGIPAGVRRVVLAACGVALVGGLAQPSYAQPSTDQPSTDRPRVHMTHLGLSGLPLPDRAETTTHPHRHRHRRETVVVERGDSLWAIAARGLPPDSPDARVAARWHAIYAANRSLIGPDPDRIIPGQRLVLPGEEPS